MDLLDAKTNVPAALRAAQNDWRTPLRPKPRTHRPVRAWARKQSPGYPSLLVSSVVGELVHLDFFVCK